MLHPIVSKLIRVTSVATILLALFFFDQRESGREIDLESGRTRTFVKYPGVSGKYGMAQENAFSHFVRTRLGVIPVAPRWRKMTSSLFRAKVLYGHGFTEKSLSDFMASISQAPIDDDSRKRLVAEMFTSLRSGDPFAVHEFQERCSNRLFDVETANDSCEIADRMD